MKTAKMRKTKKSTGWMRQSVRHDYLTPPDLVDIVLKHIGRERFTLDVCCSIFNIPADYYATQDGIFARGQAGEIVPLRGLYDKTGLSIDWSNDICWMNPPCGADLQKFCVKMLQEVAKGAEVWALLPSRFPDYYTKKFANSDMDGVLRQASFVYMIPEWAISFGLPDGTKTEQAKTSWWLCHFGKNGAVERYKFRHADPFKGTKYEGVLLCPLS